MKAGSITNLRTLVLWGSASRGTNGSPEVLLSEGVLTGAGYSAATQAEAWAQLVAKGGVQIPDPWGHARSVSPKRAERTQLLESLKPFSGARMSSHLSPVHTTCLTPNPTFLFLRGFAILQLGSHFVFLPGKQAFHLCAHVSSSPEQLFVFLCKGPSPSQLQ